MAGKHSKRYRDIVKTVNKLQTYGIAEAIELAKSSATAKFDESIEVHVKLGADPAKGDQQVRGTVVLPHGTGKTVRVAVFAEGEFAAAAQAAGADRVGGEDLVQAIDEGWSDFDILVAHPAMMRVVGRLGKKLGPRMPSKKAGNITEDVGAAVAELKAGRVEFRMDRTGVAHVPIGKVSFDSDKLMANFVTLMEIIVRARPAAVSGRFVRSVSMCSSMGPGIKLDLDEISTKAA
jgi:large subunit ribosomal protein L1